MGGEDVGTATDTHEEGKDAEDFTDDGGNDDDDNDGGGNDDDTSGSEDEKEDELKALDDFADDRYFNGMCK
jgi:hypothetical protein